MTDPSVVIREAEEDDVVAIRDIFVEAYGKGYAYPQFLDTKWLKRSIYTDDILMLVALDRETGTPLGTASVALDTGAHSDLIGEFGRLVVSRAARGRGIGSQLMEARIEFVQPRLHAAIVENRTPHSLSQRISQSHGFAAVGYLPRKHLFDEREDVALFVRHFGQALTLRRNHPRIIPEAYRVAHQAMENCRLPFDAIVDEASPPFAHEDKYTLQHLTAEGLPALLRIERGRVRNRMVFGPMRLQYGFFKLSTKHADFLIASANHDGSDGGPIAGAVGYIKDDVEKSIRVFELISRTDDAVHFLFDNLLRLCREKWDVEYVEVDVSAHAPRMQRTLLELGFLPAAYLPALVFAQVERLDVVKMVRLLTRPEPRELDLIPSVQLISDLVMPGFRRQAVVPELARAVHRIALFGGLDEPQASRVAGACAVQEFPQGTSLFREGEPAEEMFIIISGEVEVSRKDPARVLGAVGAGETVGERALMTGEAHTASVTAETDVVAAVLSKEALHSLTRQRPDIGMTLFRNLAVGLGSKLQRMDVFRPHADRT